MCAAVLALAACSPLFPGKAEGPFVGDWHLVQAGWGDTRFTVEGAGITLISDGDSAAGFSGCRDYAFELSGDSDDFSVGDPLRPPADGPAAGGFRDCIQSIERIESRYLNLLRASDSAEVREGQLLLSAGNSYLFFVALPAFPGPRLVGTEWVLMAYGETRRERWATDVIGRPTLRFIGPDRFAGDLGCGSVLGTYRVIRTEVFVTSLHRYEDEGCRSAFSGQDQVLARFLDGFRAFLIGDDHLMLSHDRLQLMYRAEPPRRPR